MCEDVAFRRASLRFRMSLTALWLRHCGWIIPSEDAEEHCGGSPFVAPRPLPLRGRHLFAVGVKKRGRPGTLALVTFSYEVLERP